MRCPLYVTGRPKVWFLISRRVKKKKKKIGRGRRRQHQHVAVLIGPPDRALAEGGAPAEAARARCVCYITNSVFSILDSGCDSTPRPGGPRPAYPRVLAQDHPDLKVRKPLHHTLKLSGYARARRAVRQVGTAHALGGRARVWSKLAHLGCRPQDLQLRDRLETLTLSDGGVVNLRCTEDHAFCLRVDRATELSQPSSLPLTHEPFSSVAHSAMTAATAATGSSTAAAAARALFLPVPAVAATTSSAPSVIVDDSAATAAPHPIVGPCSPAPAPPRRPQSLRPRRLSSQVPRLRSPRADDGRDHDLGAAQERRRRPGLDDQRGVDIAFRPDRVTRNVIIGVGGSDIALAAGTPLERLFQVTGGARLRIESSTCSTTSSLSFDACSMTVALPTSCWTIYAAKPGVLIGAPCATPSEVTATPDSCWLGRPGS